MCVSTPADQAQAWPGQAHAQPGAASPPCACPALSVPARCPNARPHVAHSVCPSVALGRLSSIFRCDTATNTCAPFFQI